MRIGPLRHRLTLQQRATTQDAAGEETGTASNIASIPNVWGDVRPASGGERFLAGAEQRQAQITHTVTIRYRSDLSVEWLVLWDGKTLEIQTITDPSGKRQYTVLLCREVQT